MIVLILALFVDPSRPLVPFQHVKVQVPTLNPKVMLLGRNRALLYLVFFEEYEDPFGLNPQSNITSGKG